MKWFDKMGGKWGRSVYGGRRIKCVQKHQPRESGSGLGGGGGGGPEASHHEYIPHPPVIFSGCEVATVMQERGERYVYFII